MVLKPLKPILVVLVVVLVVLVGKVDRLFSSQGVPLGQKFFPLYESQKGFIGGFLDLEGLEEVLLKVLIRAC